MKTDDHKVTVPLADYNAMKEAYDQVKDIKENLKVHQQFLKEGGLQMDIDLTKTPVDCSIQQPSGLQRYPRILFKYPNE